MVNFRRLKSKSLFGLTFAGISVAWCILQAVRGWRGITLGHYDADVAAARILASGSHSVYNLNVEQVAANAYFHANVPIEIFVHSPQFAWALIPLAHLSAGAGFAVYQVLSLVALAVSAWLMHRYVMPEEQGVVPRLVMATSAVFSAETAYALWWGEGTPFDLLFASMGLALMVRRHDFSAGLSLSLLLIKLPLVWVIPIVLIGTRRFKAAAGMGLGALIFLVTTPMIIGFDHLGEFIKAMESQAGSVLISVNPSGVLGLLFNRPSVSWGVSIVMLPVAAIFAWRYGPRFRPSAPLVVGVAVAFSLVMSPRIWEYDLPMLALPLCVWAATRYRAALITLAAMDCIHLLNNGVTALDPHFLAIITIAVAVGVAAQAVSQQLPRPSIVAQELPLAPSVK